MTTVYFWVPDVRHASGGVRASYRFVDACNARGVHASVMHQRRGFRAAWFDNSTSVVAAADTTLRGDDVLVVSELDATRMLEATPGLTKVVLNQAHQWTFVSGAVDYRHPDVASVISVSEDGRRYLEHAFPGLSPARVRPAVDTGLFAPAPVKQRTLVYSETKGSRSRTQVMRMLDNRGVLDGWQLTPLSGMRQEELADELNRAAILASFSESEGFQMLLSEAMASGCAVVGYPAGGGAELLAEDRSWPVPTLDVVQLAARIEEVVTAWDGDRQEVVAKTTRARAFVATTYTIEHEADDVVAAIEPALLAAKRCDPAQTYALFDRTPPIAREAGRRLRVAARALLKG